MKFYIKTKITFIIVRPFSLMQFSGHFTVRFWNEFSKAEVIYTSRRWFLPYHFCSVSQRRFFTENKSFWKVNENNKSKVSSRQARQTYIHKKLKAPKLGNEMRPEELWMFWTLKMNVRLSDIYLKKWLYVSEKYT